MAARSRSPSRCRPCSGWSAACCWRPGVVGYPRRRPGRRRSSSCSSPLPWCRWSPGCSGCSGSSAGWVADRAAAARTAPAHRTLMATSTKDDLQAHRFMNRRVRAALLEGDAESNARPLGRLGAGTYAGIFVTIALLAIVGIVGVLKPGGSTSWQEPGAFIVETETGARYVLVDGTLHPVLNYSSAKLLLGSRFQVVTVSVGALESAPHGAPVGIPLAPDSLPDAAHIVGPDWSACAIGNAADGRTLRTAMFPGTSVAGQPIGTGDGYLLRTTSGRTYLLWSDHAYEIPAQWLAAIGYQGSAVLPVG